MPTQHDIEAEVHATVHAFLKAWVQQGAGATDHFLTYVAEDFTGLGTAREIKNPLNFVNNGARADL